MPLKIKLGGPLVRYKPKGTVGNTVVIDSVDGLTLSALLADLNVPDEQRLLVILNGTVIPSDTYTSTLLSDNDDLALMPPIQAG